MALVINRVSNKAYWLYFARGDNNPRVLQLEGDTLDIDGATFKLSVSTEENPGATPVALFELTGVIVSTVEKTVQFSPTSLNNDLEPGTYYYDVEMTKAGIVQTLLKSCWVIIQDITK